MTAVERVRRAARGAGVATDRATRRWVRLTGRVVDLDACPWLQGPRGEPTEVGDRWLAQEAQRLGGRRHGGGYVGLVASLDVLDGPGFAATARRPEVRRFYESTSRWRLSARSRWSPVAWPFGWLVSAVFARRLEQLSLPLRAQDLAGGMTSRVEQVRDDDGRVLGASWLRTLPARGAVVYSGWYGTVTLPGADRLSVRVVFPLPEGRLVVLLRPEVGAGGALELTSGPGRFGQDGAYLVVQPGDGPRAVARRVPVHERFRVFVDDAGVLRTAHALDLWSLPVLRLHYRLDELPSGQVPQKVR